MFPVLHGAGLAAQNMCETPGEEAPETGRGWVMDDLVIPSSFPFEDDQAFL